VYFCGQETNFSEFVKTLKRATNRLAKGIMSRRNKLQKFAEILTFPNVYENFTNFPPQLTGLGGKEVDLKGKWKREHFKNDHPITLELACGRGEYTVALAEKYPNRNFIGVDIKGARIWKGARIALEKKLTNAAFLRTRIELILSLIHISEPTRPY